MGRSLRTNQALDESEEIAAITNVFDLKTRVGGSIPSLGTKYRKP
jgi:hypothetical protein